MEKHYDEPLKEAKEEEITSRELLEEILPLIKEFFLAKIRFCGDEISLRFPNGQRAVVTAWIEPSPHSR